MIVDKLDGVKKKFRFFEDFWQGDGPFPILFTRPHLAKSKAYIKYNLVEQHEDVEKLLKESLLKVEPHMDLIDDGIPVVRSDLGTTLLPSGLGIEIVVQPDLHPWIKNHLSAEEFLDMREPITRKDINNNEVLSAKEFYTLFQKKQRKKLINPEIYPYVPDTQGIFDLSHILIGTDLFILLSDRAGQVHQIQHKSLELFLSATRLFKDLLGESPGSMVHGHGMPAGVWFPHTGARISEDSCTLISEEMIREFCLPYIIKAIKPFSRGFMHYCGKHDAFLKMICELQEISTLNLGNPEAYDLDELFSILGRTGTVYFGALAMEENEDGHGYLERMAYYCRKYSVKLVLVFDYCPENAAEKKNLVRLWHRLTKGV